MRSLALSEVVKVKIEDAVIGIAGAGGLGSNVAASLVRIGFKKLIIADFDRVDQSNLNRQFFFRKDIGQYKVDALKENLESITEAIDIRIHREKITPENLDRIFQEADIMVEALDDPGAKAMLVNEW